MDTAIDEQTRAEREAKITLVGDILAQAGCLDAFEHLTVEQVERLHDAILTHTGTASAVALHMLDWCRSMQTDPAPGSMRYTEGWNASLQALGERIRREFGL